MSTTMAPPVPSVRPPAVARASRWLRREVGLLVLGVALIALHVVDDAFLHPEPGTSAGDHVVSGLVPVVVLALAALAYPRLRGAGRGALALTLGVLGVAAGVEAAYYT